MSTSPTLKVGCACERQEMDWTGDGPGQFNNSPLFNHLVEEVAKVVSSARVGGSPTAIARTIVSHLAHAHGLGPRGQ